MKQYYGTKPKIGASPSRAMGKGVIGRMQKKRKKKKGGGRLTQRLSVNRLLPLGE